jgi:hypothetical protein
MIFDPGEAHVNGIGRHCLTVSLTLLLAQELSVLMREVVWRWQSSSSII